jgi:hypothetical protein
MFIPSHILDAAVEVIVNTRDFCGNEAFAVREFCNETGFKSEWQKIHRIANFRANAKWNAFKKAAGVNPKHCF